MGSCCKYIVKSNNERTLKSVNIIAKVMPKNRALTVYIQNCSTKFFFYIYVSQLSSFEFFLNYA